MLWLFPIIVLPYFIILLKVYSYIRVKNQPKQGEIPSVKISVIIACKNEENNLQHLLADIGNQDYSNDKYEVIVVDDNSADNTLTVASLQKKIRYVLILPNRGEGKKSAIRTGVNEAHGELIVTTDADCRMGRKWLSSIASSYSQNFADMIIGTVQLESRTGFFGRFQELEFLSLQGITMGAAIAENPVMCNGANLAFKKQVYLNHSDNLHDEIASGDDIFLLHSLKKTSGSKIELLSSAEGIVTTSQSGSFGAFLKQRSRWLSKAGAYEDTFTKIIAFVTFVTIISTILFLILGIFDRRFFLVFLVTFIIKSIPDFLILYETTRRFNRRALLIWFLPSQVVYPFYVLSVFCYSLFSGKNWK